MLSLSPTNQRWRLLATVPAVWPEVSCSALAPTPYATFTCRTRHCPRPCVAGRNQGGPIDSRHGARFVALPKCGGSPLDDLPVGEQRGRELNGSAHAHRARRCRNPQKFRLIEAEFGSPNLCRRSAADALDLSADRERTQVCTRARHALDGRRGSRSREHSVGAKRQARESGIVLVARTPAEELTFAGHCARSTSEVTDSDARGQSRDSRRRDPLASARRMPLLHVASPTKHGAVVVDRARVAQRSDLREPWKRFGR